MHAKAAQVNADNAATAKIDAATAKADAKVKVEAGVKK
jgi:hypothetical protein